MAKEPSIDPETFRQSLRLLSWSYAKAAEMLGVHSRQRVADWAKGRRPCPHYIAKHLGVHVDKALRSRGI